MLRPSTPETVLLEQGLHREDFKAFGKIPGYHQASPPQHSRTPHSSSGATWFLVTLVI